MKARSRLMVMLVSMATIGGLTVLACSVSSTEPVAPAGAAGVRAYIDPDTGRPAVPPPDAAADVPADLPVGGALGLGQKPVEVPNPGPSGGFMLDTRGLGVAGAAATVDVDGKVTVHCDEVAPADTRPVSPQE